MPASPTDNAAAGLFGYFLGSLHDVKLTNAYLGIDALFYVAGYTNCMATGSLAGIVEGEVKNCSSDAAIRISHGQAVIGGNGGIVGNLNTPASSVQSCTFSGTLSSSNAPYTGGIIGDNYGYVADCKNSGSVTSGTDKVGGIVGNNNIPNSKIVAGKSAVIERCVNTGGVSSTGSSKSDYVGGIVGMSAWSDKSTYVGGIINCLNTGAVSGDTCGGIAGYLESNTAVKNCFSSGSVTGTSKVGGLVGCQYKTCPISNAYFLISDSSLEPVGAVGADQYVPDDSEKVNSDAPVTAAQAADGSIAAKLNADNTGIWAQSATVPVLVVTYDSLEDAGDNINVGDFVKINGKTYTYGGNVTSATLDLRGITAATAYKAADGTLLFTPADNTANPATPATLTMHNANISVTGESTAIKLPSAPVEVELLGDNSIRSEHLGFSDDSTIRLTGTGKLTLNAPSTTDYTQTPSAITITRTQPL